MDARESRPDVPRWVARATAALAGASLRVRVIAANTPSNLREELARLLAEWPLAGGQAPRFAYEAPADHTVLRRALDELAMGLETQGELGAIYAARARELGHDAALCEAAGGPGLWAAARVRYARRDEFDAHADALAEQWATASPDDETPGDESVSDDERCPASLLCRMREELGRRRLACSVVVNPNLASLAATGDGVVQVIARRSLSRRDVERTVLHEIDGHVAPRFAASAARIGIFAIGTAHGVDDQEGRALALERAAGFLDGGRRRELALRHLAARSMEAGVDFATTVGLLLERGAELADALRIAARVHRGGGLGREAVYLPALLRVEAALAKDRALDDVLSRGRVAVDAAPALRAWLD